MNERPISIDEICDIVSCEQGQYFNDIKNNILHNIKIYNTGVRYPLNIESYGYIAQHWQKAQ